MEYQQYIDWVDDRIVDDSRAVVLAFLLVTGLFAVGLGNVTTAAGTQQFTSGLPAEEALTQVNQEFSPAFAADQGNTQLIQRGVNVLSRESMLRMLESQHRLERHPDLRVTSTSSAASIVAQRLDPSATTTAAQIDAIERSTPTERERAIRTAADRNARFQGLLSTDFNRRDASASATLGLVVHEVPAGVSEGAGQGGSSPLTSIQEHSDFVVSTADEGTITVFGSGMIADEFNRVIVDSMLIVVPAAVAFILFFLAVAYRDPADLLLGLLSLLVTIVWTFGFMGLAGIPFSMMLIAVPPLLLAVGIDFGIHAVNRYREELAAGADSVAAMRITTDQLLVAFFIVTGTTVIGFGANLTSSLAPIKDFGLVAGIGIVFTFLTFGIFLPAAKVELDRLRERYPIPTLSQRPLGAEGSALGSALQGGVVVARKAPLPFLLLTLVLTGGMGVYATGVDTTFDQRDFLPPEETPDYLQQLPEPFKPGEYAVTGQLNYLEDTFESTQSSQGVVYVEGSMTRDTALDEIHEAGDDPPDSFVREDGRADSTSIVTVIRDHAARDPEFRRLVEETDGDGDGVPDDDLREVYDYLLDSPARSQALNYVSEDYRSARVVYEVEADAEQAQVTEDTRTVADRFRTTATATGQTVVFQAVSDLIFESAVVSLAVALVGASAFLIVVYRVFEDSWTLGIANVVPVAVTVVLVAGTMRAIGIPFNAITATILAITIGLGVDYSVHVTHRFADERAENDLHTALDRTVRGTGGALLGSMLTTVSGIGVLALAVFPAIGQFGVLTGISIFYAFLASILVLPPTLVVWDALVQRDRSLRALLWNRSSATA